jgi:peroxiredoxin
MIDKVKDGKTVKGVHRAIIVVGKDGLIREAIANVDSAEVSNLLKSHLDF